MDSALQAEADALVWGWCLATGEGDESIVWVFSSLKHPVARVSWRSPPIDLLTPIPLLPRNASCLYKRGWNEQINPPQHRVASPGPSAVAAAAAAAVAVNKADGLSTSPPEGVHGAGKGETSGDGFAPPGEMESTNGARGDSWSFYNKGPGVDPARVAKAVTFLSTALSYEERRCK